MINLNPISIDAKRQVYAVSIKQKLCKPFCEGASIQPVVDVKFQTESTTVVNGLKYIKVKAQGNITYIAQNNCVCNPSTKIFTEYFTLAFQTSDESDVKIEWVDGYSNPEDVNCYGVACGISWNGAISVSLS